MTRLVATIFAILLVSAVAAHLVRAIHLLGGPAAVLSDQPVLSGDYGLHAYYCLITRSQPARGSLFGYDPYFMAGYPHTVVFPTSTVYFQLLTAVVPEKYVWPAIKIGILLGAVLPLVTLPLVTRYCTRSWRAALVALLLMLSVYWAAQPEVFLRTGLASWLVSCALAVPAVAAWSVAVTTDARFRAAVVALLAVALAIAAIYCHLLQALTLALSFATVGLLTLPMRWRRVVGLGVAVGGAVALATYPLWRSVPDLWSWVDRPGVFFVSAQPVRELVNLLLTGPHHQWLVLWLALVGLFVDGGQSRPTKAMSIAGGILLGFALLGGLFPASRQLQPLRFQTAGLWLLTPGAAAAASWIYRALADSYRASHHRAVAVVGALLFLRLLTPGLVSVAHPRAPLSLPLTRSQRELVAWLREHTTPDHRILFEDVSSKDVTPELAAAIRTGPDPDALRYRISPLLPLLTNRSYIGGLYYPCYLRHAYAKFGNGRLFGRPLWSEEGPGMSVREAQELLERYNIAWVVTWSPASRRFFDTLSSVAKPAFRAGPYRVYELRNADYDYCLDGKATVQVGWNKVELSRIRPGSDGRLVLKFHWVPGLTVADDGKGAAARVEPWSDGRAPVPFVAIRFTDQVPERITLTACY